MEAQGGAVGDLIGFGDHRGLVAAAVTVILHRHGMAGAVADDFGDAREMIDRLAIDLEQQVTDLQSGPFGRAVGREAADHGPDELVQAEFTVAQRVVIFVGPLAELRHDLAMQHRIAAPEVVGVKKNR